jgi:hypothetical protein
MGFVTLAGDVSYAESGRIPVSAGFVQDLEVRMIPGLLVLRITVAVSNCFVIAPLRTKRQRT